DVVSTGVLEIQREGRSQSQKVRLTLVGTMNPEEGGLRPQLLDRFGLMVNVTSIRDPEERKAVLQVILEHDEALDEKARNGESPRLEDWFKGDEAKKAELLEARASLKREVEPLAPALERCVALAEKLGAVGHRGELTLALAARALAAREGAKGVT